MSAPRLKPIPTAPGQWWREFQANILPLLVFCGTLAIIAVLWNERVGSLTPVGSAQHTLADDTSRQLGVVLHFNGFQTGLSGASNQNISITDPQLAGAQSVTVPLNIHISIATNLGPGQAHSPISVTD